MDITLIGLIETTIPGNVVFNRYGVALNGLKHSFDFRRLHVIFRACSLNGLWGGSLDINTPRWGSSGPVSRTSFRFSTFEECTDYLWREAHFLIERNKENISMEFLHFKVAENKWFTLSSQDKFNMFKEAGFYGTL